MAPFVRRVLGGRCHWVWLMVPQKHAVRRPILANASARVTINEALVRHETGGMMKRFISVTLVAFCGSWSLLASATHPPGDAVKAPGDAVKANSGVPPAADVKAAPNDGQTPSPRARARRPVRQGTPMLPQSNQIQPKRTPMKVVA